MTVAAPPRPPRPDDPVRHGEFEALVEALIEEARQRARRRRRIYAAVAVGLILAGAGIVTAVERTAQSQDASSAVSARSSVAAGATRSQIAFTSYLCCPGPRSNGLYVVNADGSGKRKLTAIAYGGVAWSPDGRKLAFRSSWSSIVSVIDADGSGERILMRNAAVPSWSPDGRRIAFKRGGRLSSGGFFSDLWVMNADGSGERRLARGAVRGTPVWSPDGRKLAFVSGLDGNSEIYVVNTDGSGLRRLTRNPAGDGSAAWSPDGRKVAFVSKWQIWVMNGDGSGQQRLTGNSARNFAPVWSPDGRTIAFESRLGRERYGEPRCAGCGRATIFEIHAMNADGSGQRMLTRSGAEPLWSHDGRRIAFVSERDGNAEIYVMNADGSRQRNLTRHPRGHERSFAWSPGQKR